MKTLNKTTIYKLFKDCVIESLDYISDNFDENKIDRWGDEKFHLGISFPKSIPGENIPYYWSEEKKIYNYSFWLIEDDEFIFLPSFKKLRTVLLNNDNYCKHFSIGKYFHLKKEDIGYVEGIKWKEWFAFEYKIGEFVDHYIHKYNTKRFNEKRFKNIFDLWFNYLSSNKLEYDIWIPIIYNRTETNSVKISKDVYIKKLKIEQQISRCMFTDSKLLQGTKSFLIQSCTHAIVIKDWHLEGSFLSEDSIPHGIYKLNQNEKLLNLIDYIIGAINLSTGIEIGIYQIFIEPKKWVRKYKFKYFTRLTTYIEKFPISYEETGWTGPAKIILKKHYPTVRNSFKLIRSQKNKRIQFAISKLNEISTKKIDREIIFGATTALESLLCSGSQGEITYKLATRSSYLVAFEKFDFWSSLEINKILKKLYNYRSGVAHGKSDKELVKIRNIKINEKQVDLLIFSVSFLRHVILFIMNNQEMLDITKLENAFYKKYAV